jgi:hypothetical protein
VLPETLVILVEARLRAGFVKPGLRPRTSPRFHGSRAGRVRNTSGNSIFHGRGSRSTAPPASDLLVDLGSFQLTDLLRPSTCISGLT